MSDIQRDIKLSPAWLELLGDLFEQPSMQNLSKFLRSEKRAGKQIYPSSSQIFRAFAACAPEEVRVVILGQDPYHGPGQAHGLCFSVQQGQALPPSLQNIYRELLADLPDCPTAQRVQKGTASGDLSIWAEQEGVLLLNSVLTVEAHKAASHAGKGWEEFTDQVIERLAQQNSGLVFFLWGAYAQKKAAHIDESKHLLLRAPHPSPLSAHRGFFGSQPFSRCNAYLRSQGKAEIIW